MKNLIKDIETFTLKDKDAIIDVINKRIQFEELREPDSNGMVYDNWLDRLTELEEIADVLDESETEEKFFEALEMIEDFHYLYGGLSRIKVE